MSSTVAVVTRVDDRTAHRGGVGVIWRCMGEVYDGMRGEGGKLIVPRLLRKYTLGYTCIFPTRSSVVSHLPHSFRV
jgi:hypothetical protein